MINLRRLHLRLLLRPQLRHFSSSPSDVPPGKSESEPSSTSYVNLGEFGSNLAEHRSSSPPPSANESAASPNNSGLDSPAGRSVDDEKERLRHLQKIRSIDQHITGYFEGMGLLPGPGDGLPSFWRKVEADLWEDCLSRPWINWNNPDDVISFFRETVEEEHKPMEGSSNQSNSNEEKPIHRTRRHWTYAEERALMNHLKELVRKNWKTDNGFKPGYQEKLEEMIMRQLPGTDIRANPHINSKIAKWKRLYGSIQTMLGDDSSGIGLNTTTCLNDEQWQRVVKRDPSVANMRKKPWLMYEDWVEMFGNDRATGKTTENVYNTYTHLVDEENRRQQAENVDVTQESTSAQTDNGFNMETEDFCEMDGDSQTPEPETPLAMTNNQRKRLASTSSPVDPLVEGLGKLVTSFDKHLGNICPVIGYEAELGKARKNIFTMLDCIPNLTLDQKINVSKVLAKDRGALEMFIGFSDEARARYVGRLLNGESA